MKFSKLPTINLKIILNKVAPLEQQTNLKCPDHCCNKAPLPKVLSQKVRN
jgi:hypothetical protein